MSHPTSQYLLQNQKAIVEHWADCVRHQIKDAANLTDPVLFDMIPSFLEKLAEALEPDEQRKLATEGTSDAITHGGERARMTRLNVCQVTSELQILKETIYHFLGEDLGGDDRHTIDTSIDQAILESISGFVAEENRIRDQFLAMLTHDMRGPLTVIRSAAELMVEDYGVDPSLDLLDKIIKNSIKVDRLIHNILDLAQIRSGKRLHIQCQKLDIRDFVEQCLRDRKEKPLVEVPSCQGYWDPHELSRVIDNLLDNAYKYGDRREPVQISCIEGHGNIYLAVHNKGPHIPEEEQKYIFNRFYRAKAVQGKETRGWGIGTTIVRNIVEAHGGAVSVDSAKDRGTTFTVQIPIDARPFEGRPLQAWLN